MVKTGGKNFVSANHFAEKSLNFSNHVIFLVLLNFTEDEFAPMLHLKTFFLQTS